MMKPVGMLVDILRTFIFLKIYKRIDRAQSTTAYTDLQGLFFAARDGWGEADIAEIGSYKGKSTAALALGSKLAKRGKVYSIDPHTGGTREVFLGNIRTIGAEDIVVCLTATSEEAARTFDRKLRLLFIDGVHDYEYVKKDFLSWKGLLIEGGIVAFHDFNWPGVSTVIDEYVRNSREFAIEGTAGCTLFASKKPRRNNELFEKISLFNLMKARLRPWRKDAACRVL